MQKSKWKTLIFVGLILVFVLSLMSVLYMKFSSNTYAKASTESESQFIFDSINNGTEYSVRAANRNTIIQADIPAMYNGKLVTEIANNGFVMCQNLVKVTIPKTVTRIGNNAFMGCTNLKTVYTFENLDNEAVEI